MLRAFVRDGRLTSIPSVHVEAAGRARLARAAVRARPALSGADRQPHPGRRCTPTPPRCAATSSTTGSSTGSTASTGDRAARSTRSSARRYGARMALVLVDRNVRPHVTVITLNKPERLNSMSFPLVEALYEALDEVGARQRLVGRRDDRRRAGRSAPVSTCTTAASRRTRRTSASRGSRCGRCRT